MIICFDLTRVETFESVGQRIEDIRMHCEAGTTKLLIGTKCDLIDQRKVLREEAEQFADEHDMIYCETSAKGNINVQAAFEEMID